MSNLFKHAERELKAIKLLDSNDADNELLCRSILGMIQEFSKYGHSGSSAPYTIRLIEKLLNFEPLCPLTGNDDEWNDMSSYDGKILFQNNRCSHIFKDKDGAYDIEGKIFRDKSGLCYTNKDSRVYITFPYTPKREYVDVD